MTSLKPLNHPARIKYEQSNKITNDTYWNLHTEFLVPTQIKINVSDFRHDMSPYQNFFKPWGNNRSELNDIRKGLPLVNLSGNFDDDVDESIGPLDYYNTHNADRPLLEYDFTRQTQVLDCASLEPLHVLRKYMTRSSILYWKKGANFSPHWDVMLPAINLRLWGTDNPDSMSLRYKKNNEMIECKNVEAGRLYLIETSTIHDARCTDTELYQFFISLNINSLELVKSLTQPTI